MGAQEVNGEVQFTLQENNLKTDTEKRTRKNVSFHLYFGTVGRDTSMAQGSSIMKNESTVSECPVSPVESTGAKKFTSFSPPVYVLEKISIPELAETGYEQGRSNNGSCFSSIHVPENFAECKVDTSISH